MATAAPAPTLGYGPIEDPVTLREASALFAETPHPIPESTLRRLAKKAGLKSVRGCYSDSELLELHRDRVERANSGS